MPGRQGYHEGFDDRAEICRGRDVHSASPPRPDGKKKTAQHGAVIRKQGDAYRHSHVHEPVAQPCPTTNNKRSVEAAEEGDNGWSVRAIRHRTKRPWAVKRRSDRRGGSNHLAWAVQHGRGRQPVGDGRGERRFVGAGRNNNHDTSRGGWRYRPPDDLQTSASSSGRGGVKTATPTGTGTYAHLYLPTVITAYRRLELHHRTYNNLATPGAQG